MVKLKNINVFIFAVILLLSGCAKMQYNYVGTYSQLDFPPLQQKVSVYVGDRMLIQGVEYKRVFLNVENTSGGVCYTIPHGRYGKVGEDSKKNISILKVLMGSFKNQDYVILILVCI